MLIVERVEINPAVCGGKPVIRERRILVRNLLGMVAGGYSEERVVESYPELSLADVVAALEYAARVVDEDETLLK